LRNWQHRVQRHNTKTDNANTQHNMSWTPLYPKQNTNNINRTWAIPQTTESKDEPNIAFMRKSKWTSQHGTLNVETHNRTAQKIKIWATRNPPKNRGWTRVLAKGKQFLPVIKHPPCYSYNKHELDKWLVDRKPISHWKDKPVPIFRDGRFSFLTFETDQFLFLAMWDFLILH
jgi:hypothetical protein